MSGQSSHPFTCNTCQVAFRSGDLQRTHMQSDWHRYNLKRRVASLPPLSSEIFAEKVLANKATAAETAARASFEKACRPCGKTYYSENAFINHLSSQKHRANAAKFARSGGKKEDDVKSVMSSTFSLGEPAEKIDGDAEEDFQEVIEGIKDSSLENKSEPVSRRPTRPHHSAVDGEERPEHPLSPVTTNTSRVNARDAIKECLFCNQVSESLGESLEHMTKIHGLFIPEPDYLEDMEGLIKYLNVKVNEEHQCLYCGRLKWSEDGIKTHMRDMSHCKIAYETEDQQLEIGQFYDFRATYSDSEEDSEAYDSDEDMAAPGGGVKLGAKRDKEEGDGWETDSTASSVPTEELGRVYLDDQREEVKARLKTNRHHNHTDERRHKSVDGYHSHAHTTPHAVYHDEFEMHLPTGRIAGHRSQNKYWRQNLRTYPTPEERQQKLLTAGDSDDSDGPQLRGSAAARDRERGRAVARRNSAGALGLTGVDDAGRRQLRAVVKRDQKKEERSQRKFQARVNKIGNSQKHYRDPLLQ